MKYRSASGLAFWRPKQDRTRSKRGVAILAAVGLAGGLCAGIAGAAVTSPTEGKVIRGGTVPIVESEGAHRLNRDGTIYSASNPGTTTPATSPQATGVGCVRQDVYFGTLKLSTGTTTSPTGTITIKDPANNVVFTATSPENEVAPTGAPAGLNARNFSREGPWTANWTIPDSATPGTYTITSTAVDKKRNPNPPTTGATGCTDQAVRTISVSHFIYRPWTNKFKDLLGNGDVSFNLNPPEFQATVLGTSGPITDGATSMTAYKLQDPSTYTVPADPTGCASNPTPCLPAGAVQCAPADASCVPTVLIINSSTTGQIVEGVFNLDSHAFIAHVQLGGTIVTMFSLGTDGDAQFRDLLAQLAAQAASQGVDLMSLLATTVQLRTVNGGGQATVIAVSLLQGLQIYSETPKKGPAGLSIIAPITATVGLFAHSYSFNAVPNPTGVAGTTKGCSTAEVASVLNPSPCTTPGPYKPKSGYGYTALKSDLLPDLPGITLPAVPGAPAALATVTGLAGLAKSLVPTKVFNIYGKWPIGKHQPLVGVDTAPGEPNGLPVWLLPLSNPGFSVSDPAALTNPLTLLLLLLSSPQFNDQAMDFLGTATYKTTETCSVTACSGTGSMTGLGVGIFSQAPLPFGFRSIPLLWDRQDPQVVTTITAINTAIADAQTQGNAQLAALFADPTVAPLLAQIFASIPAVPAVPAVP